MKYWQDIINRATLGTAKLPLNASDLPSFITNEVELPDVQDSEENFLRFTSLLYQYRQSGAIPLNVQSVSNTPADTERKPYCSSPGTGVLKSILSEEHSSLLRLWLQQCHGSGQLAEPEIIPELLDIASHKKELRKLILEVSGERGQWLCQLNPHWSFSTFTTDIPALWQTGKPEERKELLLALRKEDPDQALELLQTTWAQESANEKVVFLEITRVNLSGKDLVWLESLKEKSQKVSSCIMELIKSIPSSGIVTGYRKILKEAIVLKSGKALLGMINKTMVEVNEQIIFPEELFKSGIEKLSSNKNISDNQYILIQLLTSVPPSFLSEDLNTSPQTIIELIQKDKKTALYLPALAIAAVKFKETLWIKALLDHGDASLLDSSLVLLIGSLPEQDRDVYAKRFIKEKPQELIQLLLNQEREWSADLAKSVLKYTANEVYQYNKTFYRPAVALIPVSLLHELESFTPAEEGKKVYWKNQQEELSRLLTLKRQILQAFQNNID